MSQLIPLIPSQKQPEEAAVAEGGEISVKRAGSDVGVVVGFLSALTLWFGPRPSHPVGESWREASRRKMCGQ